MSEVLIGHEELNPRVKPSQVYQVTHDGAGNRLPLMNRAFISFTYDGKTIEDYNLIAIIESNSLSRHFYADFEDSTSDYEVLDGQFYWGSHYKNNTLELKLVTDGITEQQLAELKRWLVPGPAKELILSENPNRGIQARISEVPSYEEMVPFEKVVTMKIMGQDYQTSTTNYRGFISLTFVMDDPFWYSIKNIIPLQVVNANNQIVNALEDKDTLKVILEDNIPYVGMLQQDTIVGDGIYDNTGRKIEIVLQNNGDLSQQDMLLTELPNYRSRAYLYYGGTAPGQTKVKFELSPRLAGAIEMVDGLSLQGKTDPIFHIYMGEGVTWTDPTDSSVVCTGNANYNVYCRVGVARVYKDVHAAVSNIEEFQLLEPRNSIFQEINRNDYNVLTVGDKSFKFTTPSIYTGYNQAIQIMDQFEVGDSFLEARTAIRDGVKEYYSRAWAMAAVDFLETTQFVNPTTSQFQDNSSDQTSFKYAFNRLMWLFLIDNNGLTFPADFYFDSRKGEALGKFTVRYMPDSVTFTTKKYPDWSDTKTYAINACVTYQNVRYVCIKATTAGLAPSNTEYWKVADLRPSSDDIMKQFGDYANFITITENVGDMVYDKYLILEDRNYPNDNGNIYPQNCATVTTDFSNGLYKLGIDYKHEYL